MKIYHNGKEIRNEKGRFTSKFMRRIKQVLLVSFVLLAGYITFSAGQYSVYPQMPEVQVVEAEDTLESKIENLKNEVVESVRLCESRGHEEEDGIIIFDSNKEASIGNFQFQRKTVVAYYKMLYGQDITIKDAVLISLDEQKARSLAKDIIFKDEGKGVNNWWLCSKKHNLVEKVELIKELEK